jgi:hypothetical protein
MQFWQAASSELPITLEDPSLLDECQLGKKLGMKAAGSKGL